MLERSLHSARDVMSDKDFLRRALGKVKRFDAARWTGYLTSAEIVAIADAGIRERADSHVARARQQVSDGQARSVWFYFTPTGALIDALKKAHPKEFK